MNVAVNLLLRCAMALSLVFSLAAHAAIPPAPDRQAGEGSGPYTQLILRGVTVVDGTGAPAYGPADIVIEGNRIIDVRRVGYPGLPIDEAARPKLAANGQEIELSGYTVLPGIVDMHGHIGGEEQGVNAEYVYKLWLAHGITSIRDPGCGNGLDWCVSESERSKRNAIVAPRIFPYVFLGAGLDAPLTEPEQARRWVRDVHKRGALGMKCFGHRPEILAAVFDELAKLGMRSACHHAQLDVARVNVLTTARQGLTTMEHWYGLPEALFDGQTVQQYPADYNYQNEQQRFFEAGRLWQQASRKGSERYEAVIKELLELDFTLDPTFTIYQAARDWMRARTAEWHASYTHPALWDFFRPGRDRHGSFFFDWGTEEEVAWKNNYRLWMEFVNDYKNRGGRVTVGSDSGYIYKTYGFGTIEEMELLREAGFHPLEVIRAASLSGAEALGMADRFGSIEPGKLADLLIVEGNPLANLKILYGTGHIRLDAEGLPRRHGGVSYTVKDGVVYSAKALLADVASMVTEEKKHRGATSLPSIEEMAPTLE